MLYLVRHTSVDVPQGTCYGQADVALASTFEDEATTVKSRLTSICFGAVYASPLIRCTKLAQYCGYSSYIEDSRLMEMSFGRWEYRLWDSINDPQLAEWFAGWKTERTPQGESFEDVCQRARAFLREAAQHKQDVLAFTHAGFIRAAWVVLGIRTPEEAFATSLKFGEIASIQLPETCK